MTPQEIDKEKAIPIQETKSIQPKQAVIEKSPAELGTPQKLDTAPPDESDRQYANKVNDYKAVVSSARAKGIDLNNQEGVPLLDSDKERIIQNASKLAPKELVTDVVNRINTYAQPEFKKVPELDQKRLMEQERKARKARWGDALYAFGEGLQGKTANPELYASNRIQRKQDQEFQNYQAVTEQNRIARNAWNTQTTNETIKWLDEQANNERLDKITRDKMNAAAEELRKNLEFKDKSLKQAKEIADNKDKTAITVAGIRENQDKKNRPVIIQTAKNTYQLKPEEAAFYKGEVMKNSEEYRAKYPGWFEKVQKTNDFGEPIEGEFTYKLNPRIKDQELIRAYLEENQEGGNQKITPQNQAAYLDKYRKAKGQPTSDIPVSETVKAGSLQTQYSQPQSKLKADPLGLGL